MSYSRNDDRCPRSEKDLDIDLRVEDVSLPSDPSRVVSFSGEAPLTPPPVLTAEEERRLWRKIDWHIVPIITIMYLCSFVDRSNIGTPSVPLTVYRRLT